MTVKDGGIAGHFGSERIGGRTVAWPPPGSQAAYFALWRPDSRPKVGLTGCLRPDASAGGGLREDLFGPDRLVFAEAFDGVGGQEMAVDLSMAVLVVDDYSTMIRIIRNLLKQLGFENIDDASDGSEALNKMRGKKYGLVISDWNMEPMTGYDLLREVRADVNLATTPFIMITAESKTENVIAAKKAGVNNYIVKPFNAATLKTKIEAVFPDMASA
jgi:two-component system chemotaxis response regulator CheY